MSAARRAFLKQAGLGTAALLGVPSIAHAVDSPVGAELASADREWDAAMQPPAENFDVSWTQKLTGKHKAMFDVPEIGGGVGVSRAAFWGRQYMETLKVAASDLSTVIVIRHAGIFLLMNQEYWATYEVAKERKIKDDDGKELPFNPVLAKPDAPEGRGPSMMLDAQIRNGAIVLGCNLAFRSVVSLVEKKDKLPSAQAREKAKSMIVPGVIMQPSGIFANVLAQEAGCVFVQAV